MARVILSFAPTITITGAGALIYYKLGLLQSGQGSLLKGLDGISRDLKEIQSNVEGDTVQR